MGLTEQLSAGICSGFGLLVCLAVAGSPAAPPEPRYEGIAPGFDFPAGEKRLDKLMADGNLHAMRRHMWMVFAGMTQPALQTDPLFPARHPAKWETWFLRQDAFAAQTPPRRSPLLLRLTVPGELKQAVPGQTEANQGQKDELKARFGEGNSVLFNRPAFDRIRSATQPLYQRDTLEKLCGNTADQTVCSSGTQDIDAFPRDSVALKAFFMLVKKGGCTRIGSWDFNRQYAGAPVNDFATWPRSVWVANGTSSCPDADPKPDKIVPLSEVYAVPVPSPIPQPGSHEPAAERIEGIRNFYPEAAAGDYLVLVGMHVNTRETPDWLWATFWWHDSPSAGPFSEDRPAEVRGAWRHYLMNLSYDMDNPRETDGTPHIAYNPYLEGRFRNGVTSNCMSCHRRAAWPLQPCQNYLGSDGLVIPTNSTLLVVRGKAAAESTYFNSPFEQLLRTSFIWSVPIFASTPVSCK